jgi:photosystem II stability/assembly factor-like uncharacterized protein
MKWEFRIIATIFLIVFCFTPNAMGQWVPMGFQAIETKGVPTLAVKGGKIFAGVLSSGVYLSNDSGANWSQVNTGLSDLDVIALGANNSMLLAATDTGGLFISMNDGTSWAQLTGWTSTHQVIAFAFLGTNIFVATDSAGISGSTDGGLHWASVNNGLTSLNMLGVISTSTALYANTVTAGVFRSTDNGANWISASQGLNGGVDVLITKGDTLIGGKRDGIYFSVNSGRTWQNPHPRDTFNYVNAIAINDSSILMETGIGFFRSTDNGITWSNPKNISYLANGYGDALAVIGADVIAATTGGLYRSTNYGSNWLQDYNSKPPFGPPLAHRIYCITYIGTTILVGTDTAGVFYSNDNGSHWYSGKGLSDNNIRAFAQLGSKLFACKTPAEYMNQRMEG